MTVAATTALLLLSLFPAIVAAGAAWTVVRSPGTIYDLTPTEVVVYATNVSTGGEDIACVKVTPDPALGVGSVRIVSVTNGHAWSVAAGGSPTTVTATANADSERIQGKNLHETVAFGVTVTGVLPGTYTWTLNAWTNKNCSGGSLNQTKTFTVTVALFVPPNGAPQATADGYAAHVGALLAVAAPGVLGNDSDPDGDPIDATLVSPAAHGVVDFAGDGSFTYLPDIGYLGSDSFTYEVSDGQATSGVATVTVTVANGAPVATVDAASVSKNVALSVSAPGLVGNDTDPDGDTLIASLASGPTHGVAAVASDGSWTYAPVRDYTGGDAFTYSITDGYAADSATVTLTIANDAPGAVDDGFSIGKNLVLTVGAASGVLANDTDINGDGLAASIVSGPTNGIVALAVDGSFTYTPSAGFVGSDTFVYAASDGTVATNATVTIGVANAAPVASDDTAGGRHDRVIHVAAPGVLGNDSDANGDSLTAVLETGPTSGSIALSSDGSFDYTPNAGFVGTDSFSYWASDGTTLSNVATVTLTITNSAPVAVDNAWTLARNGTLVVAPFGVLANDSDADGDTLSAALVTGPTKGSLTFAPDGSFTYVADPGFVGTDSFTYRAGDGITSTVATVSLDITNTRPVARPDAISVTRNGSVSVAAPGLLANDTDADGDALTATLVAAPAHGTVTVATDGSLTYAPDAGFSGMDAFMYSASDGLASSPAATVTISITNRPPTAPGMSVSVVHDHSLSVPAARGLLVAASDPDGDSLRAALTSGPSHGTANVHPDGSLTYVPDAAFVGTDSFNATISDGRAGTVVTIDVDVTNVHPTVEASGATRKAGPRLSVAAPGLLAGATDSDGDPLTVVVTSGPSHGTLTVRADGSFTYLADDGFSGADGFTYLITDGVSTTDPLTETITVEAPVVTPAAGGASTAVGGFEIPGMSDGGADIGAASLSAAVLGNLSLFLWAVPGAALAGPGIIIVIITILAQMTGGAAWLPLVRRRIGAFGLRATAHVGGPR